MKITPILLLHTGQLCAAQQRTNMIHIIASETGWDDLTIHGSPCYRIPRIDELACNKKLNAADRFISIAMIFQFKRPFQKSRATERTVAVYNRPSKSSF